MPPEVAKRSLGTPEYALATSERGETCNTNLQVNPQPDSKCIYPHLRSEHVTGTGTATLPTNRPPKGHATQKKASRARPHGGARRAFSTGAPSRSVIRGILQDVRTA